MARGQNESIERYEKRVEAMPNKELLHEIREARSIYPRPRLGELTAMEVVLQNLTNAPVYVGRRK